MSDEIQRIKYENQIMQMCDLSELIGKVFDLVKLNGGAVEFFNDNKLMFCLHHEQSCCEWVELIDGFDELHLLQNDPIMQSYATYSHDGELKYESSHGSDYDSLTWSFYTISTFYHSVTLRFYGQSNGCYSETADLYRCLTDEEEIAYKKEVERYNAIFLRSSQKS